MIYSVKATAKVVIKEYWVVRFIVDRGLLGIVSFMKKPWIMNQLKKKLLDSSYECDCCDFVSVIKNYKILK